MRNRSQPATERSLNFRIGTGQDDGVVDARARSAPRVRFGDRPAQWMFVLPAGPYLWLFFGYPLVENIRPRRPAARRSERYVSAGATSGAVR